MRLGPQELLVLLVMVPIYFVPLIVAAARRSRSLLGIGLLNVLAGWTFVGWVGALIWAVASESSTVVAPAGGPGRPILCSDCGKYSEPGVRFCAHCGAALA